ncbi:MAG: hypothetical protein Q8P92_02750 [Candidatus Daviesbacteria bacterium]|nr:hypothetical protein [Candidatus Daviesbacteria bacterium]
MERDLIKPRIRGGFYPVILSTFLGLSSIACGFGQGQSSSPDNSLASTTTPLEPDLEKFLNGNPSFRTIYQKAREKNMGIILVAPENVDLDIWIRFQRVDIVDNERMEQDLETVKLTPQQSKNYTIFLATACNGKYQISISLDGEDYTNLPLPDLNTGVLKETFFLRPSCTRPVTVSFEKPDHV